MDQEALRRTTCTSPRARATASWRSSQGDGGGGGGGGGQDGSQGGGGQEGSQGGGGSLDVGDSSDTEEEERPPNPNPNPNPNPYPNPNTNQVEEGEPRRKSPRKLGPPGQEASEPEAGESTPSNSDEDYDGSDEEMLLSELLGSTPDRPVSVDVDDD